MKYLMHNDVNVWLNDWFMYYLCCSVQVSFTYVSLHQAYWRYVCSFVITNIQPLGVLYEDIGLLHRLPAHSRSCIFAYIKYINIIHHEIIFIFQPNIVICFNISIASLLKQLVQQIMNKCFFFISKLGWQETEWLCANWKIGGLNPRPHVEVSLGNTLNCTLPPVCLWVPLRSAE